MKKIILFLCAIALISCGYKKVSIQEETLRNIQQHSIYAAANDVLKVLTGDSVYTNIRIAQWDETPVDTMTFCDIYDLNHWKATRARIEYTFGKVEPQMEYEYAISHPELYSQQQILDRERELRSFEEKDSILGAESQRWLAMVKDSIDQDKLAYLIYHFVACATTIRSGEDKIYDFGYSFYNVKEGKVDTTIIIGDDIKTFFNTEKGVEFQYELPLTEDYK